MPASCRAYDGSAPEIVQEAIRKHLKEPHLDTHMCCMIGDVGGRRCEGKHCAFHGPKGKKMEIRGPVKLRQNDSTEIAKAKSKAKPRTTKRAANKSTRQ